MRNCFGCGKPIGAWKPHIHVELDDWATRSGLDTLGLDDVLGDLALCEDCTQPSADGWDLESHEEG